MNATNMRIRRVVPEQLDNLVPLNALPPERRASLARNAYVGTVPAGDCLFRAGELANTVVYLLHGCVELCSDNSLVKRVRAGDANALHPLAHQSPRRLTARCATVVSYLAVDSALLDVMLTWDQQGCVEVGELDPQTSPTDADWISNLLRVGLFQRLPPTNLQGALRRLQPFSLRAGEAVIEQGDEGRYFYVLTHGHAAVSRRMPTGRQLMLAQLRAGDCFGEEALLSEEPRNATITMQTDGRLMRLSKADFREHMKEPLLRRVSAWQARRMASAGGVRWLDVRLASEFALHHLPGSLNVPLYLLRRRLPSLDRSLRYIVCCDAGRRSAVATFLLMQAGYDCYLLERGWNGTPMPL